VRNRLLELRRKGKDLTQKERLGVIIFKRKGVKKGAIGTSTTGVKDRCGAIGGRMTSELLTKGRATADDTT